MRRALLVLFLAACSSGGTTGGGGGGSATGGGSGAGGGTASTGGGSGSTGGGSGMANLPDGGFSACGLPGNMGNDAGVGKFCDDSSMCPASAPVCSSIANGMEPANMMTFYCVAICDPCMDPMGTVCGSNSTCICQAVGECGCVPNSCQVLFDAGVSPGCDGGP